MEKLIPVGELLKKSFQAYRPRVWNMLWVGLLGWAAITVIFAVFGVAALATAVVGQKIPTFSLSALLLILVGVLLAIIVTAWVQIAQIYLVRPENAIMGVKQALLAVRGQIAAYYWVVFLRCLVIVGGFILFIVPGIIFSVWFSVSQYAFIIEGKKGTGALGRSRQLVKGYFWPVLGRLLLMVFAAALISSVSKIGFLVNALFTMPFAIVYGYMLYEDLKRVNPGI